MKLFVIEETTPAGGIMLIRVGNGRLIVWEEKEKNNLKSWFDVLDNARGQKSTPLPHFGKHKFRIIELQEVKRYG